jgi:hypothetical protein
LLDNPLRSLAKRDCGDVLDAVIHETRSAVAPCPVMEKQNRNFSFGKLFVVYAILLL